MIGASNRFQFSFGNTQTFLGDGYRSLMLSEYSNNFLNFKLKAKVWEFKYLFMVSQLRDFSDRSQTNYWDLEDKYTATHYMSWNITGKINLSFFESIVWRGQDTLLARGIEPNYLNPVIFFRPVEYSLGSTDNSILGLNFSWELEDGIKLYHQLVLDEFLLCEIRARNGWWRINMLSSLGQNGSELLELKTSECWESSTPFVPLHSHTKAPRRAIRT